MNMKKKKLVLVICGGLLMMGGLSGARPQMFAANVDPQSGAIQVPENYTQWATLGTWSHAGDGETPGAKEFHTVYTQPETVAFYQKHGRFPDGAVLVKELLETKTLAMTTGPAVSHASKIKGWFVLVRDTQGRFPGSKLWGDGWGWSYFKAENPQVTESTDYQEDCVACHLPARDLAPAEAEDADRWVYTLGYPVLQGPGRGH